mgnify:CR=1 FL=1
MTTHTRYIPQVLRKKTSGRFFEGILQTATATSRRFPGVALGLPPVRCVGSSRTRLTEGAATTCGGGLQTAAKVPK